MSGTNASTAPVGNINDIVTPRNQIIRVDVNNCPKTPERPTRKRNAYYPNVPVHNLWNSYVESIQQE